MTEAPLSADALALVEWGVAGQMLSGESVSGDLHVVADFPGGVLAGVIDGLGHGTEAAEAARLAAGILAHAPGEPLDSLIRRCHEALRRTRGAVISLAGFEASSAMMRWIAVGNVEGVLFRGDGDAQPPREGILQRSGVVGYQLPTLRVSSVPIARGDTLILATDGIRRDFVDGFHRDRPPKALAEDMLERYGKSTDDALVLVLRYLGASP